MKLMGNWLNCAAAIRVMDIIPCVFLIVDPPATGLSKALVETLIEHPPRQLIYVSCNPATLARDLATVKETFRIDSITPLDMFPQTAELEVVVELSRAV